ncbi:MAG: type II toxin-antitoxin system HipA family toxin [Gammaproteobacteria bacterium]|nr:type II toxin-antitoxin system HipA family toxin [Gammaproteobacteria bacterium]
MAPGSPLTVLLRWEGDDVQTVGRLASRDRVVYLEWDEAFLSSGLELSPVRHATTRGLIRPHDASVFGGLHGLFHDSLPDGWGRLLVDRRAREHGIEPATLSPLDRLACVGDAGVGALCYAPAADLWGAAGATLDLDRLAADARRVLAGHVSDILDELGRVGGSPAGARPKACLAINARGDAIRGPEPPTRGFEHYLVKFRGADDPEDAAHIEQAYADMARAAGVRMPVTRLVAGARGEHYFASRRFDRDGSKRLHAHTASGLLYADSRLPSLDYRDLIGLTRSVTRDRRQCRDMFSLAAFNVLSRNRDDHARQFTFLMTRDGHWRLAPAYDLTFAPGPVGEHFTSVLGRGREIDRTILLELGRYADLTDSESRRIVERVSDAVAAWDDFARSYDVSAESRNRIGRTLSSL